MAMRPARWTPISPAILAGAAAALHQTVECMVGMRHPRHGWHRLTLQETAAQKEQIRMLSEQEFALAVECARAATTEVVSVSVMGYSAEVEYESRSGKSTWNSHISVDPETCHLTSYGTYTDSWARMNFESTLRSQPGLIDVTPGSDVRSWQTGARGAGVQW